jgi:hypothetical protein
MADDGHESRIDLARAAQLIEKLEQDLRKVHADSADLQRLRDEVETLKNVLSSPAPRAHWVREGLHSIRQGLDHALDAAIAEGFKGGQYVAEIGRILGL